MLEDFVTRDSLFIIIAPDILSTNYNGSSNVDDTMCTGNLLKYIGGWCVSDEWTTCDHPMIMLKLVLD